MIKRLLVLLVLGLLVAGAIFAVPPILNRASAQDQAKTESVQGQAEPEEGSAVSYVMTRFFESAFRIFMNAIPPDKLVDIAMESQPDVMETVAARFETRNYASTIDALIKNNPMFLSDLISGLDMNSLFNSINLLLIQDPAIVSDAVSELDSESVYNSINILLQQNPAIISDAMSKLDTNSLAAIINTVSTKNPEFMPSLAGQIDLAPFAEPMARLFEENPDILVGVLDHIDDDTLNTVLDDVFGKMRTVDVTANLPEQPVDATLVLPDNAARVLGTDRIKVKLMVETGEMDVLITDADIRMEEG